MTNISKGWLFIRFKRVVNSIAFYPAIIALLFLVLSALMIYFDFSDSGKQIKSSLHWLRLRDATTARSIISSIVSGIISLAVFSFSMVMIVLNQTASQMSNRILDKLIGNRFQQIVLGIYIGTIVYALFLLTTIRDIDSGLYIPALSTYLLIVITVTDIFLFIYFLHFITQSVKYSVIIKRIYEETKRSMEKYCTQQQGEIVESTEDFIFSVMAHSNGMLTGFDNERLLSLANKNDFSMKFMHPPGTFVLGSTVLIKLSKVIDPEIITEIRNCVFIEHDVSIDDVYSVGFRQLTEVAVRALSPGINDPGTAIAGLRALSQLLMCRSRHFPATYIRNDSNKIRIVRSDITLEDLFLETFMPIWDYGKNDRLVRNELQHLLFILQAETTGLKIENLLSEVQKEVLKSAS